MTIKKEDIIYRPAGTGDIETLVEYRVRFLNELLDHPDDEETSILRHDLHDYFTQAFAAGEFIAWLAEHEGEVIATSGMVLWRIPTKYGFGNGRLGYILNMYTTPEARGLGIGTILLEKLLAEARELKLPYVHLHASDKGIPIYLKAGLASSRLAQYGFSVLF